MSIAFGTSTTVISPASWEAFKSMQATKTFAVQFSECTDRYDVFGFDGPLAYIYTIYKGELSHGIIASGLTQEQNDTDKANFEASYKPTANRRLDARTSDGRLEIRHTAAKRTTNFNLRAICFYTSKAGSVHNVNPTNDVDFGDVTLICTKWNGSTWVAADDTDCTRTLIDFEPTYNYEIIGGTIDIPSELKSATSDAWFISVIGVPDYGAGDPFYGSVAFINEVNLEAVTTQKVTSDGRAISYMAYNYAGYPHTNKMRIIIKHPAGVQKRFQIYLEHFV